MRTIARLLSPLLVAILLGACLAGDRGAEPSGWPDELGRADGFGDSCAGALDEEESEEVVEIVATISERYLAGLLTAEERDREIEAALEGVADLGSPVRLGTAKALVAGVAEAMAAEVVLPLALGRDRGREPTAAERQALVGLGIEVGAQEAYLDGVLALFEPSRDALEARGARLSSSGWDLADASFVPEELDGDPETLTALALFLSPAAAAGIADPERTEAVVTEGAVFLPPDRDGVVQARSREAWEGSVALRMEWFARDLDAFVGASRESATYWNLMSGRLWQLFGLERGHDGRTAPEIERDAAYDGMLRDVSSLRALGVHRELVSSLHAVTRAALQVEERSLEAGLAQLDLAFRAALAAPAIPLVMYLAPVVGGWLGPSVALATAQATSTLALVPFAFALGSAVVHAAIDASMGEGGFACHFVRELFHRSVGALWVAPFVAALPMVAAGGGLVAGLATASPVVAVTSYGLVNLGVAVGFVSHMALSGLGEAALCRDLLARAEQAAAEGEPELVEELTVDAVHACADAGIDLAFAAVGGRSLARSTTRVVSELRGGRSEIALVRRETGERLPADYYERLGVEPGASGDEIATAYRRLALRTHPDRGGSAAAFRRVAEAFEVLGDPAARALYDHAIGLRPLPEPAASTRPSGSEVLGRPLAAEVEAAIDLAHRVGWNEVGRDGVRPAGLGNYRPAQLFAKARILRDAGLGWADIRALMEAGVVGRAARELPVPSLGDAAHAAIGTDLYRGRVVDARPFSADGNQTAVLWARLFNPRTGRSREALFKPRPWGDGDGWNRTPGEYVAYALNRLLGMDYVPPAAYRRGVDANFEHHAEGVFLYLVPDARPLRELPRASWGVHPDLFLSDARILDVLLQNPDRHLGNFLYGRHWVDGRSRPMLIDHAASFRPHTDVRLSQPGAFGPDPIVVVRRSTLEALRALDFDGLESALGEFVSHGEIRGILSRRDGIVRYFESLAAERGEGSVILDVDD